MTMAEDVGHRLQGVTLMEHASGKTMAKGMGSFAGELDTRGTEVTFHDSRKRGGARQRVIGRPAGKKNLRIGVRGAGVSQVIQQALSHWGGQRQAAVFAIFDRLKKDLVLGPVDILQAKRTHLAAPYAVGVKQLQDGIIPSASVAIPVDAAQDLLGLRIAQPAWNRGQFVSTQGGDRVV